MAGETYSFRFFDSNIWYLKIMVIYKHLKHLYKRNCSSRNLVIMLGKAQKQCLIEIVASQWSHTCHMPSPLPWIGHPHLLSPTDSCWNLARIADSGNSSGIRFGTGASQNGNSIPAEYPPESAYSRNAERNDRNGIHPECVICIVYYI